MTYQEYPKWKYKFGSDESALVKTAEDEQVLGAGWVDFPKPAQGWPKDIKDVPKLKSFVPRNPSIGLPDNYTPAEYPKYVKGQIANNYDEEQAILRSLKEQETVKPVKRQVVEKPVSEKLEEPQDLTQPVF